MFFRAFSKHEPLFDDNLRRKYEEVEEEEHKVAEEQSRN